MKSTWLFSLAALFFLWSANAQPTRKDTPQDPKEIDLENVPVKSHRIARQLLTDREDSSESTEWDNGDVTLHPLVRTLYRIDVDGPAYHEFRVTVNGIRQGFILVSNGEHDFEIPHWSEKGPSPTERLDKQAAGKSDTIAKYYKLDSLSYLAEDENGNNVAQIGEMPMRIVSKLTLEDVEEESIEADEEEDDDPEDKEDRFLRGRGKEKPVKLRQWADTNEKAWKEMKAHGAEIYEPLITSLKRDAFDEWEEERLIETYGEGLVAGETRTVALLFPDAKIQATGAGAQYVRIQKADYYKATIHVTGADPEKEVKVLVRISYKNGQTEVLKFTIVPEDQVPEERRKLGAWSAWNYFYADPSQRWYRQIPKKTTPNTSSCYSGCGATAWAMLFGWADYRASFDSKWSKQWCLYRPNGGTTGDAVAPSTWDAGVKNMIWEIRNDIGTWCWGDSGATNPWDMNKAYKYAKRRCGYHIKTNYNPLGISTGDLREKARDAIVYNKTPAIIGTGWLSHYPLAYGYAWRKRTVRKCFIVCWTETEYSRWFLVNQGWGGSDGEWVSASTWFAGRLYPN